MVVEWLKWLFEWGIPILVSTVLLGLMLMVIVVYGGELVMTVIDGIKDAREEARKRKEWEGWRKYELPRYMNRPLGSGLIDRAEHGERERRRKRDEA